MSGQQPTFSSGHESYNGLPFSVPGIAGQILRIHLDTWEVRSTNQRTGQVRSSTCTAASVEQAVMTTHHQVIDDDPDCTFDQFEVNVTLVVGARKLWDVVPIEQAVAQQSVAWPKPSLIGRVVAVDEDGAIQAAAAAYRLDDAQFCVRQV